MEVLTAFAPRVSATTRADTSQPPAGFAELYRDAYQPMVRLAYLMVDSNALAEELVQDAFVRVWHHWDRAENKKAYLRTAVVNACRSHLRRRKLERAQEQAAEPPPVDMPPELDEMWAVLAKLAPRRRAALVLRFYEDLSTEQIAEALGCRPGTVKSLIHRGLADVKKLVEA
jgi:RNA polymerase sigma-70 factor (sigma-E family)